MLLSIILLPLFGAIINGFFLRKAPPRINHLVGMGFIGASFLVSLSIFMKFLLENQSVQSVTVYTWIQAGKLSLPFSLLVDQLSAFMIVMVTGIAFVIHIYAGGYMSKEKTTYRFFAYLNLFVFMMLILILADNMVVMFVGWEGVGLCSYLLIGYWFHSPANAAAGKKAFIVNRIGDIGFLIAIFMTYTYFQTLSFSQLKIDIFSLKTLDPSIQTVIFIITAFLFVAACGKSAQIPLYIWLPDAMAGPTPVSALIHAATMVTAGIYMMTRLSFMFYLAPAVLDVIAVVGGMTAFFAATVGTVQRDIKKVLAYSTISQLGYMVMACGVSAFGAGVFHLLTHAAFKALLFLGAGSVITAMHHEQDIYKMGGLKKSMPMTYYAFLIGVFAIIGVPGFSGFFSKDEILWKTYENHSLALWLLGTLTAGMTAFYMIRLLSLTFLGKNRSEKKDDDHPRETPRHMWISLWILAFLSIALGFLGIPEFLAGSQIFEHYLHPVITPPPVSQILHTYTDSHNVSTEWILMLSSVSIVAIGAIVAYRTFRFFPKKNLKSSENRSFFYQIFWHKYWVDEFYDSLFVQSLKKISWFLWRGIDRWVIDGVVRGSGGLLKFSSSLMSMGISGSLNRYSLWFFIGFFVILIIGLI